MHWKDKRTGTLVLGLGQGGKWGTPPPTTQLLSSRSAHEPLGLMTTGIRASLYEVSLFGSIWLIPRVHVTHE